MECYTSQGEYLYELAPLREAEYYLFAEIPNTLADTIESCEFYVGFAKNLSTEKWIDEPGDCDDLYLLEELPTV